MKSYNFEDLNFFVRNDSDCSVVNEICKKKIYERPNLGFTLRPKERVLDCGAHIGAFSVWAAKHRRCKVVAAEASKGNSEMLRMNVAANKADVKVMHGAIAIKDGSTSLWFNEKTPSRSSALKGKKGSTNEIVKNICLPSLLETFMPSILKIDIEGGEFDLLDNRFSLSGIRAVMLEYHFRFDQSCEVARKRLKMFDDNFAHKSVPKFIYENPKWIGWIDPVLIYWND